MDKKEQPSTVKKFKYQFTKTMYVLAVCVILLCAVGIAISVYRIVKFGLDGFSDFLQSPLLIVICLFCIVLVISLLVKSQYVIDDTHYTTQFGFIKSKYPIKDITALQLDTDTKKLTVFIGEEFSVLSLNEKWQNEFIAAMRAVNPSIDFSFTLAETNGAKK